MLHTPGFGVKIKKTTTKKKNKQWNGLYESNFILQGVTEDFQ